MLVDCHIYENQIEQAKEQIQREPRELPKLHVVYPDTQKKFDIFKWSHEDVFLTNYNPHPPIKFGEVVV
jgi:thymidylate synthase